MLPATHTEERLREKVHILAVMSDRWGRGGWGDGAYPNESIKSVAFFTFSLSMMFSFPTAFVVLAKTEKRMESVFFVSIFRYVLSVYIQMSCYAC